ncbi:hypothetical protein [Tolypothrix sp. NIES-4075]|uniref:hypothetical protein n=1 Tax=Tolypothrix sp. NIES-4075 TaxID=2005459 RepID=UPI0013569F33|nr:hypothetical protein [Tolypothrix sp. NIES-4075]
MRQRQLPPILWVMGTAIALLTTSCESAVQYLPPLPRFVHIAIPLQGIAAACIEMFPPR